MKSGDSTITGQNPTPNKSKIPASGAIAKYEPAITVGASACVTCHAEFHSNIITDFGYGSSYFFGNPGEVKKPG